MDDRRARPGEQRRHHQTDALAGTRRRKAQHMLRTMMAEVGAAPPAQQHAVGMEKPRLADLARLRPARGAVGRDLLHFSGPPHRHGDRHDEGRDAAGPRDEAAGDEDVVGISVISEPPPEEGWRLVHRPAKQAEPGMAEPRLEGELPGGPLRRRPEESEDDGADEKDLAPENLGRVHESMKSECRSQRARVIPTSSRVRRPWSANRMAVIAPGPLALATRLAPIRECMIPESRFLKEIGPFAD